MRPSTSPLRGLLARWPFALLLASVGLTGVAAIEAVRTARSNGEVAGHVLSDYSSFVAWAYAQHLQVALRDMAQEAIGAVNHGSGLHTAPDVPDAAELTHYLFWDEHCYCHHPVHGPNPETFFAFEIASNSLDAAINKHPDAAEGWETDRPTVQPVPMTRFMGYSPAERAVILRDVKHMARGLPDPNHGYTYLTVSLERGPRVLGYTLMPTIRGDTMVYGMQYTTAAFAGVLRDIMRSADVLPEAISHGRRNADIVDVSVSDASGTPLFASGTLERREFAASVTLSPRFATLVVRAAIHPDQAGTLVVGGLPASRLPFLAGLLALATALTVVAVMQLRREAQLARVRSDWIASVSHELRTPLAQIRLYVDTLRLGRAPTRERADLALDNVDRETTRLSHLVEKVLSFSRFGRGADSEPQSCDAAAEARRIVDEFQPLTTSRNVTLVAMIDDIAPFPLRRDSLRHILLNLLDNAVKYGPPGQRVSVRVADVGGALRIEVSDQGAGVPAAERESVWRPFVRGARSQEQGGSGIGLTIVREVAAQHGGRTWVEEAEGGGARFVVVIPRAADVA